MAIHRPRPAPGTVRRGQREELLEPARESVSLPLRRKTVAVAELVERATETVRSFIAARDHTLTIRMPSEPIFVDADAMWLSHVLQHLLANAAKYTIAGGRVGIDAQRDENEVVLRVSDTGVGIEAAQLEAIFNPNARIADTALRRSSNGLGLGLYLARLLIEAHGGTIRAASAGRGRGSELVVRLPCRPR